MDRRLFLTVATAAVVTFTPIAVIAQTTPPAASPAPAASPPAAPPTRVRGTIASLNGDTLTVTSRTGQSMDIALSDKLTVVTVTKVDLASIAEGSYVGIATRTGTDGKQTALEVLVFPEAMRGAGEGHYPWDLESGSTMTNGTVKGVTTANTGRELTVAYKDGSTPIVVPPSVPIVTFGPAQRADLKPGAPVFLAATKTADGKLTAARVTVGTNGVAPPM